MATKKKVAPKGGEQYVKKEEFENAVSTILDRLDAMATKKADAPVSAEEVKVAAAGPDRVDTNPEWDEEARKILGDLVDHTEVKHERSGGIKFTVVIKKTKSNAPEEYLRIMGQDRRTKDVGSTGMDGVVEWCKLIRQNIRRTSRE